MRLFRRLHKTTATIFSLTALLATPGVSDAQERFDAPPGTCPDRTMRPVVEPAPDRSQAPLLIYARKLDAANDREGQIAGDVELFRADQHLQTERLLFDPASRVVTAPGPVYYRDSQVWIRGSEGRVGLLEESGYFSDIDFGLTGSTANGSASSAELSGGHTSRLFDLEYTTCPSEQPDWQFQMKELELRHDEGMGSARGAKLRFKGVPVLYMPWFTFPIDDRRRTGFLYPTFGYSSDTGLEASIPLYWNIAPNQDATFEPRWFSERGFMLTGEYRFMTRLQRGEFNFDYMPNDRKTDEKRYHYQLQHYTRPASNWSTELLIDRVSDVNYFQDYGNTLRQTARQFLRSSATLRGVGQYWDFEFMADDFQLIDESITPENEPYRRVPRMLFRLDQPLGLGGLTFGLDSEVVAFDRDAGVTGTRLDLYPSLYWDHYHRWGFIKPQLGYRYTAYELDYGAGTGDESPSRGAAIASLDAGLVFDRFTADGGYQTLEPRLYYLYVPYEEQDDLPLFDTGEFTFGFSQLFNPNRFAGGDRLGDTNQLSVAISTRKFDSHNGAARWSLGFGQIFYFSDRRVQLDGDPVDNEDLSPFLGEFTWYFSPQLSMAAGLQWNWDRNRFDVGTLNLAWTGDEGQRVGFEYRYRTERVDQFDLRLSWPIADRWVVLTRLNYSFADDDVLELQGGFEYESCCWAIRTVLRRYLRNRDGEYRNGIFVEFNLKGLASIGSGPRGLF